MDFGTVVMLFLSLLGPIGITFYLNNDAKKRGLNNAGWAVAGGISGLFSWIVGVLGFGVNMLVLSIYFFKTQRTGLGVLTLILFLIGVLIWFFVVLALMLTIFASL